MIYYQIDVTRWVPQVKQELEYIDSLTLLINRKIDIYYMFSMKYIYNALC